MLVFLDTEFSDFTRPDLISLALSSWDPLPRLACLRSVLQRTLVLG